MLFLQGPNTTPAHSADLQYALLHQSLSSKADAADADELRMEMISLKNGIIAVQVSMSQCQAFSFGHLCKS